MRKISHYSVVAVLVIPAGCLLLTAASFGQTAPDPVLGYTKLGAGIPTGPSPDAKNNLYSLDIYYFNADNSLGKSAVTVPNIPMVAGWPNPTPAQILAARTAKAAAIVAAINAAKLNGVTAAVDGTDPTQYTVSGVRRSIQTYKFPKPGTPGTYLGPAITRTAGNRVTGEIGNTNFNFNKNPGGGGGTSPSSMFQGSMTSVDSNNGLTTAGLDYSDNPSQIGFGFIDYTGSAPIDYFATLTPSAGLTDAQVLGQLASQFNTNFSSSGYTATFDSSTGWLSIDQPLAAVDALWTTDSDVNLDFEPNLVDVPEPASIVLLAAGTVAFLPRRRRHA